MKIVHDGSGEEQVRPLAWTGTRHALATWNIPPPPSSAATAWCSSAAAATSASAAAGARRLPRRGVPRAAGGCPPCTRPRRCPSRRRSCRWTSSSTTCRAGQWRRRRCGERPAQAAHRGLCGPGGLLLRAAARSRVARARRRRRQRRARRRRRARWQLVADKLALDTDRAGAARAVLKDLPPITRPSELLAELTYNDPNGEAQTVATTVNLWPSCGGARHPGQLLGQSARAGEVQCARARHHRQADREPACRGARPHRADDQHAQAHGRRLLRLRQPHRGPGARHAVQRQHRCPGPPGVRGHARDGRPGGARRPGAGRPGPRGAGRHQRVGHDGRASSGSRRTTTTASSCCPRRSATSPARPRACSCACPSARPRRW